ncbi:hypothetical protein F5Y16DRAFT_384746 [Xylariaceae sp. FL0255]|nr:hypothetical protein F5Y16DRAFT_384746 [Xylariaceae sp. FL0255]
MQLPTLVTISSFYAASVYASPLQESRDSSTLLVARTCLPTYDYPGYCGSFDRFPAILNCITHEVIMLCFKAGEYCDDINGNLNCVAG